ncbi:hypothetical protein V5799_014436 [Amblyomma americanum]|uniref:Secreted protein n=1 Tax=Amblyomma americanum TaxID=6943 RepID=A0AAQ4E315_AMBAM
MKAYLILVLVILGHLSQIHAAAMNSPKKVVKGMNELEQSIYEALKDRREDIIAAGKALKTSMDKVGDETDEQFVQALIIGIIAAVAGTATSAAVSAAIKC